MSSVYKFGGIDWLPPSAGASLKLDIEVTCQRFTLWVASFIESNLGSYANHDNLVDATISFHREGVPQLIIPFAPDIISADLLTGSPPIPGTIPKHWADFTFLRNQMTGGSSVVAAQRMFYAWKPAHWYFTPDQNVTGAAATLSSQNYTLDDLLLWAGNTNASGTNITGWQFLVKPHYFNVTANRVIAEIKPWKFQTTATPDLAPQNQYMFSLIMVRGES